MVNSAIGTAERPFFGASKRADGPRYYEDTIRFAWHKGMSWQVRQRSSDAMADAIVERYGRHGLCRDDILEVSTASHDFEVGRALSALNLMRRDSSTGLERPLENWFQASKVYARDGRELGPYLELLDVPRPMQYLNQNPGPAIEEKYAHDELFRSIQSDIDGAALARFEFGGQDFPLVPRSCFYDYLYVTTLMQPQNAELAQKLTQYRVFTDIAFNPGTGKRKKYNTQARACAIYVALKNHGLLDSAATGIDSFIAAVRYEGVAQDGEKNMVTGRDDDHGDGPTQQLSLSLL